MIPGGRLGPPPPARTRGHQSPLLNLREYDTGDHVGVAMRELMKRHQVSQAEMARCTGKSTKHINQILQSAQLPSPLMLWQMARVLYDEPRLAKHVFRLLQSMQNAYITQKTLDEYGDWEPQTPREGHHE